MYQPKKNSSTSALAILFTCVLLVVKMDMTRQGPTNITNMYDVTNLNDVTGFNATQYVSEDIAPQTSERAGSYTHFGMNLTTAAPSFESEEAFDSQMGSTVTEITPKMLTSCFYSTGTLPIDSAAGTVYFEGSVSTEVSCKLTFNGIPDTLYRFTFLEIPTCDIMRVIVNDVNAEEESVTNNVSSDILDTGDCVRHAPLLYTFTHDVDVNIYVLLSYKRFTINFNFTAMPLSERPKLEINYTTPMSGYVQTPGWGGQRPHPSVMDTCLDLRAPQDHAIMLSFLSVDITASKEGCDTEYVAIHEGERCQGRELLRTCSWPHPEPALYNTSLLSVRFHSEVAQQYTGFRMFFSFHNDSARPEQGVDSKWNCSVPFLCDFMLHFICSLQPDCASGEDNAMCSEGELCGLDLVAVGNSCYRYVKPEYPMSWNEAQSACLRRGGQLASLVTPQQWLAVQDLLKGAEPVKDAHVFVGLRMTSSTLPDMYHDTWQWSNKKIAYFLNIRGFSMSPYFCAAFKSSITYLSSVSCDVQLFADYLCEIALLPEEDLRTETVLNPPVGNLQNYLEEKDLDLVRCPRNHSTHTYLACDVASDCWGEMDDNTFVCETEDRESKEHVRFAPSFRCRVGGEHVPYTLVCDHRPDCCDQSDETFCVFPPCDLLTQLNCGNNECIPRSARCDGIVHCTTGVDEYLCRNKLQSMHVATLPPPGIVTFDGTGNFSVTTLHDNRTCPETHYQCLDGGYCLPVFTRCNGVYDCPTGEDEDDCGRYTCPGFYRCRGSTVCAHPTHLCDGVFQCPQQDDELLCNLTCPDSCFCYGMAFYCSQPFHAASYPQLRYLDARGTGMSPGDLSNNIMLIHLCLADNGLTDLDVLHFPNLHSLDLSRNQLRVIRSGTLEPLVNLRVLQFSGNPVASYFPDYDPMRSQLFPSVLTLDVSDIKMTKMPTALLGLFPNVRNLNLSNSDLYHVDQQGFRPLRDLRVLDLRGCPVESFTQGVFSGLDELGTVYAENYKLCCPASLPDGFNLNNCYAPSDEISSCESLLRSEVFRAFLALFAALALVGNVTSFIYRVFIKRVGSHMGFDVFVTHLCVADFLMGVYLVIIGAADRYYSGTYLWNDSVWKQSPACKTAGFLVLLSSEVSAFIICLITAERFLVIRFPLSTVRFRGWSAQVACAVSWAVGVAFALVPLLPATAHWDFYGQTGICIPLPITRNDFPGHSYSMGLMIVLNFVLFVLIAVGQGLIYWSVRFNDSNAATVNRVSESTVARRLLVIVASDFLCWFPIGLLGLLASSDVPIPGKVNVAMAIFVLPFNSALNPFLYTLNVMLEKRRKAREDTLFKVLMSRLQSLNSDKPQWGGGSASSNGTANTTICLSEIVTDVR